jgi:hypothetical protein
LTLQVTDGGDGTDADHADWINPEIIHLATTKLAPANWAPIATNTADTSGVFQFIDLQATNYPGRFYRLRVP